jgi:hypothetical protein
MQTTPYVNSFGEKCIMVISDTGTERHSMVGEYPIPHRIDGPAVTHQHGTLRWFLYGRPIRSNDEFKKMSGISDSEMIIMVLKYGPVSPMATWI